MASPKKKWLRKKLAELAEQEAQNATAQSEPVVEEVVEAAAPKPKQRTRKKK